MTKKIKFSEKDVEMIKELYSKKISMRLIGEQFGVGRGVIKSLLVREDVFEEGRTYRKYSGNFDYFKNIDSPEKAYWLGFIYADGMVSIREDAGNSLKIRLSPKDREHLELFVKCLGGNFEIKNRVNSGFSEGQPCIDLEINSNKMVDDLVSHGVLPSKSLTLQPPNIAKNLEFDFIRGYFDGDGSIYKTNQYNNYCLSILGTEEVLTWIQERLGVEQKLEQRFITEKNTYHFRVGGTNKPYKVLNKIYNGNICLKRKFNIYQELQSFIMET